MTAVLSVRLRVETKNLHTEVERAGIMPTLLRGHLARPTYCALLRNLHALYEALEPALLRHAAHAAVAPVFFPALFRQGALADDLNTLHGPGWLRDFALKPATQQYVARLHTLDAQQPELLAAHVYVRYLGDLSGGQMLRKIVAKSFQLDSPDGTRFYDFGSVDEVDAHLRNFRAGLGAITTAAKHIDALVAEARNAFGLHRALFVELADAGAASTSN